MSKVHSPTQKRLTETGGSQADGTGGTPSSIAYLPPRLIDIDPLLLSNLELEVMLNLPVNAFPRNSLMQLADLAARYFVATGRFPGWGAWFDSVQEDHGRVIGASYRFDGCVCGQCPGSDHDQTGFVRCPFPKELRRY